MLLWRQKTHDGLSFVNPSVINTVHDIDICAVLITPAIIVIMLLIIKNVPVSDSKVVKGTACGYDFFGFIRWAYIEKVQTPKAPF